MKRTPLKRKTPLRSHKIGHPPKPMARKPLRRVSKKRAKENALYLKLRKEYLGAHPKCEAHDQIWPSPYHNDSRDVHHKMGRGPHLCEVEFFLAVCRDCHDYIESHKNWARSVNLILYK